MDSRAEVFVSAENVWDYFQSRVDALKRDSIDILAQCKIGDNLIQICITEHKGLPEITFEENNTAIAKEYAVNPTDCRNVCKLLYSQFSIYCDHYDSEESCEDAEVSDAEREAEIIEATKTFLGTLFSIPDDELQDEDMITQIISDIEGILYDCYGLEIER